ncbi:gluconate 2-dehydrogenase subunit 3 family protein [Sphingomonas qomolangmaensis]|uniref:Gluconate 2-dehydrogenase subunit 3 family protein n=1 Tax=Sphingomonas qomolangmaensis TaxID=2918765 RepID=A0ABY5L547_9SPHN|nr:gluconate 2-dehydrogenase subunit 3 family protein [Sphingomonas qomolangmaensis]UUL82060.1 gluconate 2-dehydrogenase subunit 3 family protein [Sphingomonas qomolangmaensis]
MIDRRNALAGMAAMFGTALFAPIARAAAGQVVPISDGAATTAVFTAEQRALMTALSERIMPTTDTPGAIAAEVPQFIEKLLADWALPEDRVPIVAGLDAIDARSRSDYKLAGSKASAAQHDALLTLAMNDQLPGGKDFFEKFRQLVVTGYFTSEIGIMQEREYLPVPGRYDGAHRYTNGTKVFSA